nr:hypothetical protein HmN_000571300 [Hymenolepis microstoma]CUU98461.1 hypothetical transcript [Hymenolepis microstoma]
MHFVEFLLTAVTLSNGMPLTADNSPVVKMTESPMENPELVTNKTVPSLIRAAIEGEESSDPTTLHSSKQRDIEVLESPDAVHILANRLKKVEINVAMEFGDSTNPPILWESVNGRLVDSRSENALAEEDKAQELKVQQRHDLLS